MHRRKFLMIAGLGLAALSINSSIDKLVSVANQLNFTQNFETDEERQLYIDKLISITEPLMPPDSNIRRGLYIPDADSLKPYASVLGAYSDRVRVQIVSGIAQTALYPDSAVYPGDEKIYYRRAELYGDILNDAEIRGDLLFYPHFFTYHNNIHDQISTITHEGFHSYQLTNAPMDPVLMYLLRQDNHDSYVFLLNYKEAYAYQRQMFFAQENGLSLSQDFYELVIDKFYTRYKRLVLAYRDQLINSENAAQALNYLFHPILNKLSCNRGSVLRMEGNKPIFCASNEEIELPEVIIRNPHWDM